MLFIIIKAFHTQHNSILTNYEEKLGIAYFFDLFTKDVIRSSRSGWVKQFRHAKSSMPRPVSKSAFLPLFIAAFDIRTAIDEFPAMVLAIFIVSSIKVESSTTW